MLTIFVHKEAFQGEKRVAVTPEIVRKLKDLGCTVSLEEGAGEAAFFSDEAYREAGAFVGPAAKLSSKADFVWTVRGFSAKALSHLPSQATVIGLLGGKAGGELFKKTALRAFSLELLPRISRAQAMDVLSSQSTIAGYWAVLEAATQSTRLFPLLMTAAGTILPTRILILGAGVAGLQAIATARRLGAVVLALDVRPAAREQVESLGAEFVTVDAGVSGEGQGGYAQEMDAAYHNRQAETLAALLPKIDIVIGTALIPGKPAPQILTSELTALLRPGSVVVDLAAGETGGNCALSRPDETFVTPEGVTLVGERNAARHFPHDASALYARNLFNFFKLFWDGEKKALRPDLTDELLRATCISATEDSALV